MHLKVNDPVIDGNGRRGEICATSGQTGEVLIRYFPPKDHPEAIIVSRWLPENQVLKVETSPEKKEK